MIKSVELYMVRFYDISEWEEHEYFNTGGTRDKAVVENPESRKLYYFKTSLKKSKKDYIYEFWSEIIASEIGFMLGFNMLHYDVACKGEQLGCLSESMVDLNSTELQEGYKRLVGFNPDYNVDDRSAYTFQLIERMFASEFPDRNFLEQLIEIIVFDSIIGNEDRHQENWSLIVRKKGGRKSVLERIKHRDDEYGFAPIYDSGSSLGRELTAEKVQQMLTDRVQLEAYIQRGQSEIHWEGETKKQKHFDLIKKIADRGYREVISRVIERVRQKFDEGKIADIINHIDDCLPENLKDKKIPVARKNLLNKLVSLRIKMLIGLRL